MTERRRPTADERGDRARFQNPVAGFGVTFKAMFKKRLTEQYPEHRSRRRRASTAGTSSTGIRTGWRSASAASCAPGPARRTPSTSRARTTPRRSATPRVSATAASTRSTTLRCILCGLCVEACPTRALTMTNEYELADSSPRIAHLHQGGAARRPGRGHGRLARTRSSPAWTRRTTTAGWSPRPRPARSGRSPSPRARCRRRPPTTFGADEPASGKVIGDERAARRLALHLHRRGRPVLGAGHHRRDRRPGHRPDEAGRAQRALPRRDHDHPGGVLPRQRRVLPGHRPDRRLHRRDHDAVPLRA